MEERAARERWRFEGTGEEGRGKRGHGGDTLTQAIHCEGIVSRLLVRLG